MEAREISIRECDGGSLLRLRVKPKAQADAVIGAHGGALKLSVRAAPERGKANEAVCALVSRILGVAGDRVTIYYGEGSQDKTVRVEGLDPLECRRRLAATPAGEK